MLVLEIKSLKHIMNQLLATESFDSFVVSEAIITTFTTFSIDGSFHPDFFGPEDARRLRENQRTRVYWKDIRSYCYQIIKGRHTPLSFRLVLMLSPREQSRLILSSETTLTEEQVHGLYLNLNYNGSKIQITSAVSYAVFSMDRSLETAFESYLRQFLEQKGIDFEEL